MKYFGSPNYNLNCWTSSIMVKAALNPQARFFTYVYCLNNAFYICKIHHCKGRCNNLKVCYISKEILQLIYECPMMSFGVCFLIDVAYSPFGIDNLKMIFYNKWDIFCSRIFDMRMFTKEGGLVQRHILWFNRKDTLNK